MSEAAIDPRGASLATSPDGGATRNGLALILILILATVLRLAQLHVQSLTSDEVQDLAMARTDTAQLPISEDRFPPVYHTLLGAWLRAVPWDSTGRGLSAVCGVLSVAAVGGLGRVLGGPHAGLWAAAFMAAAPLAVWHSVEARAYSLYLLLAATALWQFMAAMENNRPRHWIGFAAAATAGAYTHYYFGLVIALAGIWLVASRPLRATLLRGMATFALIAATTAPSLWLLAQDLDHPWGYARTTKFSIPALGYAYFSYLSGYCLGPSQRELHAMPAHVAALATAPWLALLGAATVALLLFALRSWPRDQRVRWAAWFGWFALAPAAIVGVVSHFASFGYNVRHVVWACAPTLAMLAVGAARGQPRWLARTAATIVAVAFLVAHINRLTSPTYANEDVRSLAAYLAAQDPRAPVFVMSGYMAPPIAAYLPPQWPIHSLAAAEADERPDRAAVQDVRQRLAAGQAFWLAYTRQFHGDPQGRLLAALEKSYGLELIEQFAGVRLYRGVAP